MKFVAGFLFSEDGHRVALVRKNKPAWQAGRLNGIGGKVEPGERAAHAMSREFLEETGVLIPISQWGSPFASLQGNGFLVYFFRAFAPIEILQSLTSPTDEQIVIRSVCDLRSGYSEPLVYNLNWLIPMARDRDIIRAEIYDSTLPGEGATRAV